VNVLSIAGRIVVKDLKLFFRDRAAMLLGFALPIGLVTIFGAAMGSFGGEDSIGRVEIALADRDGSEAARRLVEELRASDGLEVVEKEDPRARVANGHEALGLVIEAGYGAELERSGRGPLVLVRDPGKEIEQQIATFAIAPALLRAGGEKAGKALALSSIEFFDLPEGAQPMARMVMESAWEGMAGLIERFGDQGAPAPEPPATGAPAPVRDGAEATAPVAGRAAPTFDPAELLSKVFGVEVADVAGDGGAGQRRASQAHAVSGVAVMMLLFGLVQCGATIIEEERSGTLQRLLLAPAASSGILTGKFLFTLLVGVIQIALMFTYGSFVFAVDVFRAPLALAVVSVAVAAAATGFGMLLATTCRSQKQVEGVSTLVILTMSALGGSWFPLAFVPSWFRTIGHFTLNAWAMDAYQGLFWYGHGLVQVLPEVGVLLLVAAGTSGLAVWFWYRRYPA
jgi:ABC-2 type transport system permease protein